MGWQDDPVVGGESTSARPPRARLQGGLTAARAAFPPQAIEAVRQVGEFAKPSILPTACGTHASQSTFFVSLPLAHQLEVFIMLMASTGNRCGRNGILTSPNRASR